MAARIFKSHTSIFMVIGGVFEVSTSAKNAVTTNLGIFLNVKGAALWLTIAVNGTSSLLGRATQE